MADGSRDNRSTTELIRAFEAHLSPEAAAAVRATVEADLRARRARLQAEAERLGQEIAELVGPEVSVVPAEPPTAPKPTVAGPAVPSAALPAPPKPVVHLPPPDSSARNLVWFYAQHHPGAKAGDFVAFAEKMRPTLDSKNIHHELYAQSKPDGRLVKLGERPNSRYYPSDHPEVKTRAK